jgi:Phage P22-like portal protein
MSDSQSDYDPIIDEAKQFLKLCNDADTMNRQQGLEDLKFVSAGEQWPVELQNSRNLESRPILTINKLDGYCRQVTNQQRQQRPRIKVHGMNSESDAKTAEVIEGICRHIEVQSNADNAYDTAFDYAVRMGWGYIRLITKYVSDESFDQEIYIDAVDNPFTVYFDPNSTRIDGNDAERCLITTMISKDKFRVMYPGFDDGNGTSFSQRGTGDSQSEWITKEDIRVAEYYYVVMEKAKLYLLSDGTTQYADGKDFFARVEAAGLTIENERESYKRTVKYKKLTAIEVIEERDWPSKYIPIVPVYGRHVVVGDKRHKFGIVRHAKDAQRMYNFWQTTITESVALAPKAKWIMAEGQDEGHENEWAGANVKSYPLLRYKQTDIDGQPAPPPQRLQPEPPPQGVMAASAAINQDIATLMGIYDPSQQMPGNISGKALNGQQQQVDLTNFDFYDNLTKSIAHVGKIILDLVPKIYDTQRVMRIIGTDGKPDLVTINESKQDEQGVYKVMHDMTIGQYDVVMETGPGYNSKRQAAVESMMPLFTGNQELFHVAGDLMFRNMEFPGAETIADRLAAANPLAQIDEKSDIPPQVQMQLAQGKQQVDQLQQQVQAMQMAMKQRQDIEQVKQDNETKRELLRQTAKAHNTETMAEVKVNDQNTRAITSQNKIEIEAITDLLLHHMDTARLEKEIKARNAEQYAAMNTAAQDISQGANPLTQQ